MSRPEGHLLTRVEIDGEECAGRIAMNMAEQDNRWRFGISDAAGKMS